MQGGRTILPSADILKNIRRSPDYAEFNSRKYRSWENGVIQYGEEVSLPGYWGLR